MSYKVYGLVQLIDIILQYTKPYTVDMCLTKSSKVRE